MELRRLYPEPGTATVEDVVSGLELGERAGAQRPFVVANMIATADGKATVAGRTATIANEADRLLFHHLRTQVDAILAGTGTLRIERYGRLVRDPELRAKREREGLAADPLAVVISRSGEVPFEIPLFADPDSKVLVFTAADADAPPCEAQVEVIRVEEAELTPAAVLARLRSEHGVRSLLCEGGPTLLASMVADGLLDELFLSVAPILSSGTTAPAILAGPPLPEPTRLSMAWALESEGYLFLRYAVSATAD